MDASAFRVRGEACERLTKAISALTLHKNDTGGYAYDDALIFEKQVERELERQHYEGADNGMKGLLGATPNSLNKAKLTKVYTRALILKASKAAAKEATKAAKAASALALEVEPEITIGNDAQEEADRLNMFRHCSYWHQIRRISGN